MLKRHPALIIIVFCLYLGYGRPIYAEQPVGENDYRVTAPNGSDGNFSEKKNLSIILSYQILPAGLLRFEADLDIISEDPDDTNEEALAPQVFVALGSSIYAGLGTGILFSNGAFADKPFYSLKAGFDFELLPMIYLDVNANYRFDEWSINEIKEDIDIDSLSLGGMLRLQF